MKAPGFKINWRLYSEFVRIAWSENVAYRLNFFLGRVRNLLAVILLFFVWQSISSTQKIVGPFTTQELLTYTIGLLIVRALVFGYQSRRIATDINTSKITFYFIKPAPYLSLMFIRECMQKFISLISAVVEMSVLILFFPVTLVVPPPLVWLEVAGIIFLAHVMYFCLSTIFSLIAFWSKEAFGPRFLFEWFLEFAAGAYIPLALFPNQFRAIFEFLPFSHLISTPLLVFLQKTPVTLGLWFELISWCVFSIVLLKIIWHLGTKHFKADGL